MTSLLSHDGDLVPGRIVDRPNRFVVRVDFGDGDPERVFLGDPGELEGIVEPGRGILCTPVDDAQRSTSYDAIATDVDGEYVSVRAALANDLFAAAVAADDLPAFSGWVIESREPRLPDHGRTDFLVQTSAGEQAYVEVKSCTCVRDGVALFPDRPTQRGRRHVASLERLSADGTGTHLVFVIQRPDVERFRPFEDVDPDFAERLADAKAADVGVHAFSTAFDPPEYLLEEPDVPVELD